MVSSFVKNRRGLLQHLKEHKINTNQFAVFELLVLLADASSGVVWIDAPLIISQYFHDMPLKTAQASLAALKEKGYIKSFQQQGSRGTYPILVNKYEITVGGLKGGLTDAEQTVDYRHPMISVRTEDGSEQGSENRSEVGSEHGTPCSRLERTERLERPQSTTAARTGIQKTGSKAKATAKPKPGQVEWSREELGVGPAFRSSRDFRQQPGETEEQWRDRLDQNNVCPACLNDLVKDRKGRVICPVCSTVDQTDEYSFVDVD